jgi:hypothetical protein
MGLDADGREEIERRWAALRAAKAAKAVGADRACPTLDPGEIDRVLGDTTNDAATRKWREHKASREERTAMGEGNGKVTTARPPTDCPEHPGTKLRGRGAGWCPECRATDPGRAKPAAKAVKAKPAAVSWATAKPNTMAPPPTPRPELARAIATAGPDDDQADDLALLCDALAAIRRLSPRGRRALAVLMGE